MCSLPSEDLCSKDRSALGQWLQKNKGTENDAIGQDAYVAWWGAGAVVEGKKREQESFLFFLLF